MLFGLRGHHIIWKHYKLDDVVPFNCFLLFQSLPTDELQSYKAFMKKRDNVNDDSDDNEDADDDDETDEEEESSSEEEESDSDWCIRFISTFFHPKKKKPEAKGTGAFLKLNPCF